MKDKWISVTLTLMALLVLLTMPVAAVSTTVVIGEFRTRGPNGGNDEFIELYNLSGSPVDIGGWKVNGSDASGTTGTRATIPSGTILQPYQHYLLTNSLGYSGSTSGDQTYSTGITDDGGIALLDASNTIIDQVGMSAGSAYKEGTTLAPTGTNKTKAMPASRIRCRHKEDTRTAQIPMTMQVILSTMTVARLLKMRHPPLALLFPLSPPPPCRPPYPSWAW